MGYGEVGSNGSVHWQIGYDDNPGDPPDHKDYDTRLYEEIGSGKGHQGAFRIKARYQNKAQAQKALAEAQARLDASRDGVVELDVNLRPKQNQPGPSDRWEIRIDW